MAAEEFQRLIGLRLSYRKPGHGQAPIKILGDFECAEKFHPGIRQEGPAQYGEARREEVQDDRVQCRDFLVANVFTMNPLQYFLLGGL